MKVQVYDLVQAQRPGCRTVTCGRVQGPRATLRRPSGCRDEQTARKMTRFGAPPYIFDVNQVQVLVTQRAAGLTVWWHRGAASQRPSRLLRTTVNAGCRGAGGGITTSQPPLKDHSECRLLQGERRRQNIPAAS